MKDSDVLLKPSLFERQIMANKKAAIVFLYVLVPFVSGFNIYCAVSGRYLASATLSFQLLAFIIVLSAFRLPSDSDKKLIALRYVIRGQLMVFAFYLIYVIGVRHQLEVTPWFFLYTFLLFLMMPDRAGAILSILVIGTTLAVSWLTGRQIMTENLDYLVRFYFSLILFSFLSYCGVLLRQNYLRANDQVNKSLKASEASYRELSRRLIEKIKERDEIEKKLHKAIKMETVGKMAAGVAHDLNNILSGIVTYPDLILMDLKKNDPIREPIEMIKSSGTKAAAVVEDLLTLSRRAVNISQVIDLRRLVNDYLSSPEHTALFSLHSNTRMRTVFSPDIANIQGSPVHLTKAVMNLIGNALEAMPQGGKVTLELSGETIESRESLFDRIPSGRYTVLKVSDNGIGIEEDDIEKIFEPFYTRKVMGRSGTGLGMAVVLGAVQDHNAYIDVDSIVGKGTCVTLYFPTTIETADSTLSAPDIRPALGTGETILVIDDVPEQLTIACGLLERLGYKPTPCPSGEDAVEKVKKQQYDLLVIDMVMAPGIDGLETYKRILDIFPGQKAVFATGFSNSAKIQAASDMGAGTVLIKPYSIVGIGEAVKEVLAKKNPDKIIDNNDHCYV